jgi:hypothetical protein
LLGLNSKDEADRAQLGKPVKVYIVRADELSQYKGGDLSSILHPTTNLMFPVEVDGRGRLLLEVGVRGGKWIPIRDGYQDSAPAFVDATKLDAVNQNNASIFVKMSSLGEKNLLLTGSAHPNGPGAAASGVSSGDLVATPDLNGRLTVTALNRSALAVSNEGKSAGVSGSKGVPYGGVASYGAGRVGELAPGASAPASAQTYFQGLAPTAQSVMTPKKDGPG